MCPGCRCGLLRPPSRPVSDEARVALLELLDVPLRLYEAGGGLTVVCMDEFQDLLVADDALDGLVRSVIQHHGEAAAYVFAGSRAVVDACAVLRSRAAVLRTGATAGVATAAGGGGDC